MYISKDSSLKLKGIAILFMLFLHLFNSAERLQQYDVSGLIDINGKLWVHKISPFMGICVSMFIFISGYGLRVSYLKMPTKYNKSNINRTLNLLYKYWLILTKTELYTHIKEGFGSLFLFPDLKHFTIFGCY